MKGWTIDRLKSELKSRKDVKGWVLTHEHMHRRERYFLKDGSDLALDQDREVHSEAIEARLFVENGKPGRQGEIAQKLFTGRPLAEQLDSAIAAAKETDHQAWELPREIPNQTPAVKTVDPRMAEDLQGTLTSMTQEIVRAVAKPRQSTFNSAELFLSVHDKEMHLSNGLTHRSSQSRAYAECAYSYASQGRSDEYLHTEWAIHTQDLPIGKMFDECAERAEKMLDVEKPVSGTYAVLVDGEVMSTILNGVAAHFQASSDYLKLPFKKVGDEWIPGHSGDPIHLTMDPSLDYGAATVSMGEQGLVQKPLELVRDNRVVATATDKKYGDYLGAKPTTYLGNMVLGSGTATREELLKAAPQVLEILQFSALFMNGTSGTFSSEIRLARLHDTRTGQTRMIKGGSLSGSIAENFRGARFSRERVRKAKFDYGTAQGYYGPEFTLLQNVSVVG